MDTVGFLKSTEPRVVLDTSPDDYPERLSKLATVRYGSQIRVLAIILNDASALVIAAF